MTFNPLAPRVFFLGHWACFVEGSTLGSLPWVSVPYLSLWAVTPSASLPASQDTLSCNGGNLLFSGPGAVQGWGVVLVKSSLCSSLSFPRWT